MTNRNLYWGSHGSKLYCAAQAAPFMSFFVLADLVRHSTILAQISMMVQFSARANDERLRGPRQKRWAPAQFDPVDTMSGSGARSPVGVNLDRIGLAASCPIASEEPTFRIGSFVPLNRCAIARWSGGLAAIGNGLERLGL
jgi:hypothetical protein